MIIDHQGIFSLAQAVTATAVSTNVLDFGAPGTPYGHSSAVEQDQGKGHHIPLLIQVVEDFDSAADDSTLTITLELDAAEGFGGGADKSIDLGTFNEADLVAGWQLPWDHFPKGTDLRYARLAYTVAGTGNFTAGKITAGVVGAVQSN